MSRRILAVFVFLMSLGIVAQAATLVRFADNKIQINGNSAVDVTSNISNQVWIINTVSDCYINTWGGTATAANSRKLLANSVYPVQMVSSKFSILGTATENIIITQAYPGVLNTIAIKKNYYYDSTFSNASSVVVNHNLGKYPAITLIDASGYVFIPVNIQHTSINSCTITFSTTRSGTVVANL